MPQYTTGELAKLCGVSVRTVQYYDAKDLLKPSEITEGGRRIYSEEDYSQLQLICMLKSLGLSLGSVKGILESENPGNVLSLFLDEQEKCIESEIKEKKEQLHFIKTVRENIRQADKIPMNSISDIENIMSSNKTLKKTYRLLLVVGLLMDAIGIGTLIYWLVTGIWQPFAIGMAIVVLLGILSTRMYYKNTEYICAECNERFRPTLGKFLFAHHTPKTRKLKCPKCGYDGYCIESASKS